MYAFCDWKVTVWGVDSLGLANSIMFDDIKIPDSVVTPETRNFIYGLLIQRYALTSVLQLN